MNPAAALKKLKQGKFFYIVGVDIRKDELIKGKNKRLELDIIPLLRCRQPVIVPLRGRGTIIFMPFCLRPLFSAGP
jgi:hypothetical protein